MAFACARAAAFALLAVAAEAATFGTVITIGGHASDLALAESRGTLYIANSTGKRIDVLNLSDNTLRAPIRVDPEPDSIAVSPDGRYLVVTHYANFAPAFTNTSGLTLIDLTTNERRPVRLPFDTAGQALAVAFGNGPRALLVTTKTIQLIDPASGVLELLAGVPEAFTSLKLPAEWATFPPQILRASTTVSGDGNTIVVLAEMGTAEVILQFRVPEQRLTANGITAAPRLGPRVVSTDQTGRRVMAGWGLVDENIILEAQFPRPSGVYQTGSHALHEPTATIYAHAPAGRAQTTPAQPGAPGSETAEPPTLHVMDADNLTVRERLQLRENLAGKSVWSRDMRTLYSISDSGVTVFPIATIDRQPRVTAMQEDLLFEGNACDRRVITETIDIVDPSGAALDFRLALPEDVRGIRLSQSSGTTPARIRVEVDPSAFQSNRGTRSVMLELRSVAAVNVPRPVRLLINTRDVDQRGTVRRLPGRIVDILADPSRDRLYVLRQDTNSVLVLDGTTFRQVGVLRTGNTPLQMALTTDNRFLITTADNSQILHVHDVETLQPSRRIVLPPGLYGRSIAVARGAIWVTTRAAGRGAVDCPPDPGGAAGPAPGTQQPAEQLHRLVRVNFERRTAEAPCWLGVYQNSISENSVLASSPSGRFVLMSMPDGTTVLYDSDYDAFAASRKDVNSLGGGYAAVSDDLFMVGTRALNRSLVPLQEVDAAGATVSGLVNFAGAVARVTSSGAAAPGTIQLLDLASMSAGVTARTVESPLTSTLMTGPPVGQIGQTILPFTRTLAALSNQRWYTILTVSGLTLIPRNFAAEIGAAPSIAALRNSADGGEGVAPGGLITIGGTSIGTFSEAADGFPLPRVLGGICATINDVAIPLLAVTGELINAQLPFETAAGQSTLIVRNESGSSRPFTFRTLSSAPAVFRSGTAGDQRGLATIYRAANDELVTLSNPVRPLDTLVIVATGLGRTTPAVESGVASPEDPLAKADEVPDVTLGTRPLQVSFAGLIPGFAGIYLMTAAVPADIQEGMQVPLNITRGDHVTSIAVRVVRP